LKKERGCIISFSTKKLRKITPENTLKNIAFVNSKFPETFKYISKPRVGKILPWMRGREKNNIIRRTFVILYYFFK
jgi:hypothetical protein